MGRVKLPLRKENKMDMAIYFIIVLVLACLIMSHTLAEENGYRRGVRVGEKKALDAAWLKFQALNDLHISAKHYKFWLQAGKDAALWTIRPMPDNKDDE